MAENSVELLQPRRLPHVNRKVACPFVCVNKGGVWVIFYVSSYLIYYVLGRVVSTASRTQSRNHINLPRVHEGQGREKVYGKGCKVQAAINNNRVVVIVHTRTDSRECVYSVGKVRKDVADIDWLQRDVPLCKGVNPTIAMKDNTVVFLHEANYGCFFTYYNVGELDERNHLRIKSGRDVRLPELSLWFKQPSVAITSNNVVVVSCRSIVGPYLFYGVGQLENYSLNSFQLVGSYARGYYSRISIWDNIVYAIHESSNLFASTLRFKCGQWQFNGRNTAFNWDEGHDCGTGSRPSIARSGNCVLQVQSERKTSNLLRALGSVGACFMSCLAPDQEEDSVTSQGSEGNSLHLREYTPRQGTQTENTETDILTVDVHLQPLREVLWEARPQWRNIGRALGLTEGTIRSIHEVEDDECLTMVLVKWMESGSATENNLLKALRHVTVARGDIANDIQRQGIPRLRHDHC